MVTISTYFFTLAFFHAPSWLSILFKNVFQTFSVNHCFPFVQRSKFTHLDFLPFSHINHGLSAKAKPYYKCGVNKMLYLSTATAEANYHTDVHLTCLSVNSQTLQFVVCGPLCHTRSASCLPLFLCSCHQILSGSHPVPLDCLSFLHHIFL